MSGHSIVTSSPRTSCHKAKIWINLIDYTLTNLKLWKSGSQFFQQIASKLKDWYGAHFAFIMTKVRQERNGQDGRLWNLGAQQMESEKQQGNSSQTWSLLNFWEVNMSWRSQFVDHILFLLLILVWKEIYIYIYIEWTNQSISISIYIYIYKFICTNNVTVFEACATIRRERTTTAGEWAATTLRTKWCWGFYQNAAKNEVDSVFTESEFIHLKMQFAVE